MSEVAAAEADTDTAGKGAEAAGASKDTDTTNADGANGAGEGKGPAASTEKANGDGSGTADDWRSPLAGGDEKALAELGRYAEQGMIGPALVEAKNKIRTADIRTPFPDEASDKDKTKWRKDNGVPKDAAGYFEKLPDGMEIGEGDKAGMTKLAEAMYATNAPTAFVHAAMGAWYTHLEDVLADQAEMDKDSKKATDDELHDLYGSEMRRNINDLGAWLGTAGDEVKKNIMNARMPDGTKLGNDPAFIKFMVGQVREMNPLVTVPGLGAGDPGLALADEIAKIEKTIQFKNKEYRADKKMQARYLELIAARDGHKAPDARK